MVVVDLEHDPVRCVHVHHPLDRRRIGRVHVPVRVTSRIRIPVTLLFEVLKALNQNMTNYEATFGPIREPEPPDEE